MTGLFFAALNGIWIGLIIAILVGPVFFILLRTSIRQGFLAGVMFALGIITSDSFYFTLSYFGVTQFGPKINLKTVLPIVGGIFLLCYGTYLMFKQYKIHIKDEGAKRTPLWKNFIRGFLVNMVSPSGFIYWLGVVSAFQVTYEGNQEKMFAFFLGCMGTVFGMDVIKSHYANKLKDIITDKVLYYINKVAGIILIGVGGYYVIKCVVIPLLIKN